MKQCVLCGAEYDAEPEMCRWCYSSGMYLAWKMKAVLDVISKAAGHPFEAEATGGGCYALIARLGTPEQLAARDGPVIMVTEWPDVLSGTSTPCPRRATRSASTRWLSGGATASLAASDSPCAARLPAAERRRTTMSDNTLVESREVNGFTVNVRRDSDPGGAENPREGDGNFLWLGFPHRNYNIGDEQIDPRNFSIDCRTCGGSGQLEFQEAAELLPCAVCNGYGTEEAKDLDELIELVEIKYEARVVKPVGMIDHSGVAFYLGGGPHWSDSQGWDSGTCGLMVCTQVMLDDWGVPELTDDEIVEQMRREIDVYSAWSQGEVYYFEVIDANGDTEECVGGFIGDEGRQCAMDEGVISAENSTPPEPLYTVPRLTADQLRAAGEGLVRHGHVEVAATLLAPIIVKEPS